MSGHDTCSEVAIIGAGPYGLAAAAHLRPAQIETKVFGEPMEFWWRNMPRTMLLRSHPTCSQIGTPTPDLTLDRFLVSRGAPRPRRIARDLFVRYGLWIQQCVVPDVDRSRVERIERVSRGFRLELSDGRTWWARRVVVATGIGRFPRRPALFDGLPTELASHSSQPDALSDPQGRRVVVVGRGQSALEAAAELSEGGADVEVLVRAPAMRWLRTPDYWEGRSRSAGARAIAAVRGVIGRIMRPHLDIMGPRGATWLVAWPRAYRHAPHPVQAWLTHRAVRPAVADWMQPRLAAVRITPGRTITRVTPEDSRLQLHLDDGTTRRVDHVVLATGYRVDVQKHEFLSDDLQAALHVRDGYPELGPGFESSIPGLHFLGALAAQTFGPICRFVVGTQYAGRTLTRFVARPARRSRGVLDPLTVSTPAA